MVLLCRLRQIRFLLVAKYPFLSLGFSLVKLAVFCLLIATQSFSRWWGFFLKWRNFRLSSLLSFLWRFNRVFPHLFSGWHRNLLLHISLNKLILEKALPLDCHDCMVDCLSQNIGWNMPTRTPKTVSCSEIQWCLADGFPTFFTSAETRR